MLSPELAGIVVALFVVLGLAFLDRIVNTLAELRPQNAPELDGIEYD